MGACLLAALLAACGGTAADGPPELGPLPVIRTAGDLRLPMDHYVGTWRERATLETAREELTSRCMAAQGYAGYPVSDYSGFVLQPMHGNRFGVYDEQVARTSGFSPGWVEEFTERSNRYTDEFADWDSAEVRLALEGRQATNVPPTGYDGLAGDASASATAQASAAGDGGCREQSRRELLHLGGIDELDRTWISLAAEEQIVLAEEDPRMKPVAAAWKSCMDRAGYSYRTREEARDDEQWLPGSSEEKTVAVASVRCTQSSRYLDTLIGLAAAYQLRFIEQNAERLALERSFKDTALRAIAAQGLGAIGGSPGSPPPRD